jgi:F-type H+-transporting ATPase subunit gamma
MKMVAAARLRRGQARILSARPFAQEMQGMLADILLQVADLNRDGVLSVEELAAAHPLLKVRTEGPRGLLLITADKGLCGSFNTNLIKRSLEFLREHEGEKVALFCVGRKGRDFFRRMGLNIRAEYVNIFNNLSYAHADLVGNDVMGYFLREGARDVTIIHNEFKSVIQQKLVRATLLPLTAPEALAGRAQSRYVGDFIYEPRREMLLEALFPRYLKAQIFRALLESYAAEMGARMSAMESASKNAKELIGSLTLLANKIRQAAITKEISELVGGAEALQ